MTKRDQVAALRNRLIKDDPAIERDFAQAVALQVIVNDRTVSEARFAAWLAGPQAIAELDAKLEQ